MDVRILIVKNALYAGKCIAGLVEICLRGRSSTADGLSHTVEGLLAQTQRRHEVIAAYARSVSSLVPLPNTSCPPSPPARNPVALGRGLC